MSPGPDFMVTLKQTINHGKRYAYYSSFGIGLGIAVHVGYTLLGMGLIFKNLPYFLDVIRVLGALYLIYLGIQSLKSSNNSILITHENGINFNLYKSFIIGFFTNLLNPKATLFFLSIFTAIVSIDTPIYMQSLYGLYCILANIFWYILIAKLLSKENSLNLFNKYQNEIQKTIGVVLILLGIKLILL